MCSALFDAVSSKFTDVCSNCLHLDEYFDFRNHPCLVSELYGMSVFDFLKQNGFAPFPEKHIQDFARSLLKSVECECRQADVVASVLTAQFCMF